jgi:hypothetical protein
VGYVSEAVQGATSKAYSNLQLPASIYFSDQLFYVPFAHEGIRLLSEFITIDETIC